MLQGSGKEGGNRGFDRIVLTGFRASGKSRIGRLLARELDWRFVDTDELFCQRYATTIARAVAEHGWDGFRDREERLLTELAGEKEAVIATGGGAVQHRQSWERLRRGSLVVWLRAAPGVLIRRLNADSRSPDQRPSLSGRSVADEVRALLAERTPLYRQGADLAVDTDTRTPEAVARSILDHGWTRREQGKDHGWTRMDTDNSCGIEDGRSGRG